MKYLVFSLLFLVNISCNTQESNQTIQWSLVSSPNNIAIPLNDSTANISVGLQHYLGEKPYLFNANWNTNTLQIYDLEKEALIKELTFEQEGEQGLRMDYFHVQTLDSILIFPSTGNEIVLTDTSGHVKNKIKVKSPEGYAGLFLHNSYYLSPPQISGNRLIGRVRGMVRPNEINQEQLNSMSLLMSVNLKDESISLLPFGFPEDYLENGQKQLEFSILKNGDQTVVSFMGDHKIYFKGSEEETWQSKICKSSFLDESMPTFPKDIDSRGYNTYALATSRYESLVFDPFRKVYYRFAYPTIQIESDEKLRSLRTNPGPFVIMVMDRDFNILTERKFDAGRYFPSNYFVGEKGLYLSTNHPENPEAKEDFLNFELLELIEE